jgi:hypothetical protein
MARRDPGFGAENIMFSMPEIRDLRQRVPRARRRRRLLDADFSMTGLGGAASGEPGS